MWAVGRIAIWSIESMHTLELDAHADGSRMACAYKGLAHELA